MSSEPDTVLAKPENSMPDGIYKTIKTLSNLYEKQLVGIIDWAKNIPGKFQFLENKKMYLWMVISNSKTIWFFRDFFSSRTFMHKGSLVATFFL